MKQRGRVAHVSVIGLRLGATLAALAGAQRNDLDALVLWEPIIDGSTYMAELVAAHTYWLKSQIVKGKRISTNSDHLEILGFPVTTALCQELQAVNVWTIQRYVAKHILLMTHDATPSAADWLDRLNTLTQHAEYAHVPGPQFWTYKGRNDQPLVPLQALQTLSTWISKVCL
jgi:hypothetical protein